MINVRYDVIIIFVNSYDNVANLELLNSISHIIAY